MRRIENKKVDALATLASTLTLPNQTQVTVCQKWIVPPSNEEEYIENKLDHIVAIVEAAKEDWRQPIIDYLCYGILPENPRRRTDIRRRAPRFLYYKDTLYRRSFEGMLLRCLGEEETIQAPQEAHFMWITSIWTKTSFPHKEDGVLLANHGERLLILCQEMRCLLISCEFYSSATRSIAPNHRISAI